jgi:hypothetical protein
MGWTVNWPKTGPAEASNTTVSATNLHDKDMLLAAPVATLRPQLPLFSPPLGRQSILSSLIHILFCLPTRKTILQNL